MRKSAWAAVGFTYFLMFWGNLVSATGSGLACPDWPLCHGTVAPGFDPAVILEWGHRLLAASATVLILGVIFQVLKSKNPDHAIMKRSVRMLITLLAIQILLGGTTVLLGLSVAVSTIHLLVASVVFGGLIAAACVVTWGNPVARDASPKVRRLALSGLGAMVIQLALGALVRHSHAGLACPNFPNCLDGFFPWPLTFESGVAFVHRWWGFVLLGVYFQIARSSANSSKSLSSVGRMVLVLGLLQVALGITVVLSGLQTHVRAVHAAVGYALWGNLIYIAVRSGSFRWFWQSPAGAHA